MAFKILSDEEISLLDDTQHIQYEKELEMYHHRAAFIERLEQLENAHVQPYEPQLRPIAVIGEINIKSFEMAEYVIPEYNPIEPLDLQVKPFQKIEHITPVLPIMPESTVVQTKNIQKANIERLNLPVVEKPKTVTTNFRRLELKRSTLPTVIQPSIKKVASLDKVREDLYRAPRSMPNVKMPSIDISPFTNPIKTSPVLPDTLIISTESRPFIKPEKHITELPNVVRPTINIGDYKLIKITEPTLPPIADISSFSNREFHKPEPLNKDLQIITKPNINIPSIREVEHVAHDLPEVLNIKTYEKKFFKPESSMNVLPVVAKPEISKISFTMPKKRSSNLPHITDTIITAKIFKKPERIKSDMAEVVTINVPVKVFISTARNISRLPEIAVKEAPDAFAALKELFPG